MTALLMPTHSPAACQQELPISSPLGRLRLLRLSVTDLCNFRCCYCMPESGVPKLAHSELLSFEKLVEMVEWLCSETPIHRIRLTGGEPLVRAGIAQLIRQLVSLPKIDEVSLTTNGTLLPAMAEELKSAGLSRVNISLDSLDPKQFSQITRGGNLVTALRGIAAAKAAGLTPIKLNSVLQRSTWRQELPRLLDFAAQQNFEIRFIELMRTGTEREWCESEFVSVDEVCRNLNTEVLPCISEGNSPASKTMVNWRGELVKVGWITPRSHPFCTRCERLRMDARGQIRRCLMDETKLNLPFILSSQNAAAARETFQNYISRKAAPIAMEIPFAMSQIGG